MTIEIDDDGVWAFPDFHDGHLTGIFFPCDDAVHLQLRCADGSEWEVKIENVVRLHGDNIREGNIVFDIKVVEPGMCPPELLARMHDVSDMNMLHSDYVDGIMNNAHTVFLLSSSYGCGIAALVQGGMKSVEAKKI